MIVLVVFKISTIKPKNRENNFLLFFYFIIIVLRKMKTTIYIFKIFSSNYWTHKNENKIPFSPI